jgi:hypothetical protein
MTGVVLWHDDHAAAARDPFHQRQAQSRQRKRNERQTSKRQNSRRHLYSLSGKELASLYDSKAISQYDVLLERVREN